MKKISIIVPFRNAEKYIKDCLENLLKIKYENYEIILMDDGSKKFPKQIKKYIEENKKIKYYYMPKEKQGVGAVRNYGIEKSTGKYLMFVDVDDKIDSNLLTNLEPYIEKNIDLIKYKMTINKEKIESPTFRKTKGEKGFNKLCFKDKYLDSPCLYLIKREWLISTGLEFEEGIYHEDFALMPLLILKAKSIVSTKFYGYNYAQTENSIMRNTDKEMKLKKAKDKLWAYENMARTIKRMKLKKKTRTNLKRYYTNSILESAKDLKRTDRKSLESKIKRLLNNLKGLKKFILKFNLEMYYKIKKEGYFGKG